MEDRLAHAHPHTHRVQLLVLQALLAMVVSFGGDDLTLATAAAAEDASNPFTTASFTAVEDGAAATFDRVTAVTSVLQSASEQWQQALPDWFAPHA
jgi:hypothetical protein